MPGLLLVVLKNMTTNGERPEPYVGVSAIVTPKQQSEIEGAAYACGLSSARLLLLGVKEEIDLPIILQCHKSAMEALGPWKMSQMLGGLAVDRVLFDASHGRGEAMDPDRLHHFLDAAYASEELRAVSFGVAGGLNAAN